MCEANVYWMIEGREELILESVDVVEPAGDDTWQLVGIFGDQKNIKGRIKKMNLVDHKIYFEPLK